MANCIVKLTEKDRDYYLEWSSVVDAPISRGMSLTEFKRYYLIKYGINSAKALQGRLTRVESKGVSCYLSRDLDDFLSCNRAGDNEEKLTKQEIITKYCK